MEGKPIEFFEQAFVMMIRAKQSTLNGFGGKYLVLASTYLLTAVFIPFTLKKYFLSVSSWVPLPGWFQYMHIKISLP